METIKIEIAVEKIKEALDTAANEIFKSSYSNPVKDMLEKSIKEKEGAIKTIIDEIVAKALTSPKFKDKITDAVINSMVQSAIKNR